MIKYLVLSKTEPKPPTDIQYTVTPPATNLFNIGYDAKPKINYKQEPKRKVMKTQEEKNL